MSAPQSILRYGIDRKQLTLALSAALTALIPLGLIVAVVVLSSQGLL